MFEMSHLFSFEYTTVRTTQKIAFLIFFFVSDKMCFTEHIIVIFFSIRYVVTFSLNFFLKEIPTYLHHDDNLSRKT